MTRVISGIRTPSCRLDVATCDFDGDPLAISDFSRELQIRRRAYGYNFTGDPASFRVTDLFELRAFRFRKWREGTARVDGYLGPCYRSTRIEILRKRLFDDSAPSKTSRSGEPTDASTIERVKTWPAAPTLSQPQPFSQSRSLRAASARGISAPSSAST